MKRAHRRLHRRLLTILALVAAIIVFVAQRARSERPTPAPVDLTSALDRLS